jgi:hypothetical protein
MAKRSQVVHELDRIPSWSTMSVVIALYAESARMIGPVPAVNVSYTHPVDTPVARQHLVTGSVCRRGHVQASVYLPLVVL